MAKNLVYKILEAHLVEGRLEAGMEIAIRIDQTLTQDATGTMAYLQFEAMGVPRVKTELSVSYVDHNTLQDGSRTPTIIVIFRRWRRATASTIRRRETASAIRSTSSASGGRAGRFWAPIRTRPRAAALA